MGTAGPGGSVDTIGAQGGAGDYAASTVGGWQPLCGVRSPNVLDGT